MQALVGHTNLVTNLCLSPDGTRLVSAGRDRVIRVWQLPEGRLLHELRGGHKQEVRGVALTPDARTVCSVGYDARVLLWDLENPEEPEVLAGFNCGALYHTAISPDGVWLSVAASSVMSDAERELSSSPQSIVWNLPLRARRFTLLGFSSHHLFSRDGQLFLTSGGKEVVLRSVPMFEKIRDWTARSPVTAAAISPSGQHVAFAYGKTLELYRRSDWETRKIVSPHTRSIDGLAFPTETKVVTVGREGLIVEWDIPSGSVARVLDFGLGECRCLAVSPDGATAVVGGPKGRLLRYDLD
jgi:WD40 repeat protein